MLYMDYAYVYVYIYIYIYIYMHMYIYIYKRICIYAYLAGLWLGQDLSGHSQIYMRPSHSGPRASEYCCRPYTCVLSLSLSRAWSVGLDPKQLLTFGEKAHACLNPEP